MPWLDRYLGGATSAGTGGATGGTSGPGRTPASASSAAGQAGLPFAAFAAPIPASGGDRTVTAERYPGLDGIDAAATTLRLQPVSPGQERLLSPPGGDPAAISGAGGLGGALGGGSQDAQSGASVASLAGYQLAALPGQSVAFESETVPASLDVVGAPRVRLRVTSTAADATLYVSLWRMSAAGPSSPRGLVTPVRVATTPGVPTAVDVALPAGTFAAGTGSRWRVLVSATDAGFAGPTDARVYTVQLADSDLRLPTAPGAATIGEGPDTESVGVGLALLGLLIALGLAAAAAAWRRRRSDRRQTHPEYAGVPLVVDGLVKTYQDGHRAVDDVSWRAEAGQVVGLLGPNGAGKTTTMRMLVGLIRADAGHVHVLGEPVHAGSPVLGRVGALIEGPGFLPHLTGRANLHAYWAATGRDPAEAGFAQALDVAALGDAVDRPVRTYSQGMRQRLGIAQAMLGRPEVLLLDEPTNGLDPPQIAAMRPILRAYAATGRTVVVSSHLLSEVEQTCSHVVVMNRGRVVTAGSIADMTGDATTLVQLAAPTSSTEESSQPAAAEESPARAATDDLDALAAAVRADLRDAVDEVRVDARRRTLALRGTAPRADLVAAVVRAGGQVVEVTGRRRLEEVFLGVIGQGGAPGPGADTAGGAASDDRPSGDGPRDDDLRGDRHGVGPGGDDGHDDPSDDEEARMHRLRQIRAR